MRKILFISSLNLNRRDGGALATLAYYNALCDIYQGRVDITIPEEDCNGRFSHAIPIPRRNFLDFIYPFSIHRGYRFLSDYIRLHHAEYSVCVINISRTAGDMMDLFRRYGIKTVVIHHNYEVEYAMSNKAIYTLGGKFPFLVSKIECNAYKKADINCYLTKADMKLLHDAYGETQSENYLLGVFEPSTMIFSEAKTTNRDYIIFTGSMCDYQTYHSAELFEKDYLPSLVKNYPQIKLVIAGRNPHESIWNIRRKYPNVVTVVPNPDSMNDIVGEAAIFLCPTCIGGGLKLRLMDGLRMGLPVLVHKISARGYDVFYGKPYFQVYDDVYSFMEGLNSILEFTQANPDYRREIITTYKDNFSYESGLHKIQSIFNKIL